jgi:ABC-type uncharacterized transport system substrate-binding protein
VRSSQQNRIVSVTLGDAVAKSFEVELREGLRQSGLIEGQNLQYEFRAADGNIALLPKIAAELVALKVDVIVVTRLALLRRNGRLVTFRSSLWQATRLVWV